MLGFVKEGPELQPKHHVNARGGKREKESKRERECASARESAIGERDRERVWSWRKSEEGYLHGFDAVLNAAWRTKGGPDEFETTFDVREVEGCADDLDPVVSFGRMGALSR